jgi:hypothetical protein
MRLGFFSCSIVVLGTFALGCDEPLPPTPQGAFLVNFVDPGIDCPHMSHKSVMGTVSQTARTTVAVDGVQGAEVACSVIGPDLGSVKIDATLKIGGTEILTFNVASIDSKATEAMPAKGYVGFSSVTTGDFFSSDQPCDFYIEPGGEAVKPGAAWVSFKCPSMVESTNICALAESYVLIENCAQQ